MKLIDLLFALIMTVLGLFTSGCAGRLYVGWESPDQLKEERTMTDKAWYERIIGGNGHGSQLSGAN